jgi:hypothetical protein
MLLAFNILDQLRITFIITSRSPSRQHPRLIATMVHRNAAYKQLLKWEVEIGPRRKVSIRTKGDASPALLRRIHPQRQSAFFDRLPGELRNKIYEMVFAPTQDGEWKVTEP